MGYFEALQALLGRNPNEKIQMLYITLENGKVLVFLGAPVSEGDADQIHSITFGERVSPALVSLAASTFGGTEGLYTQ
jgi:hypothetical protein